MRAVLLQADVDHRQPVERRVAAVCDQVVAHRGADLVVLPELWATGYFAFDDYERTAQPLDGPTARTLSEAARSAGVLLHAGSVVERAPDGRLYNTSLLFGSAGELLHTYRKVHLFGHQSRETALLSHGDTLLAQDTAVGRLGLAACYDLRFPELFRVLAEDGAEVFVVAAAWPAARIAHWRLLLQARALENQAWVLACNAAGRQGATELGGHSMAVDPRGQVVAEAEAGAAVLEACFDRAEVARARADFPAFSDRRVTADGRTATVRTRRGPSGAPTP
ncbi:nitrilase-related carbon-nitrogen hydrolase [Streptomyces cinereospinus]|uniref:Nitrilase-related carbon-nitrogen hydrolase n=1 Tax=Streptomyces cinereospinus TaxID=285561 RepID=A0ABV5MXE4_9ACTN